MQTVRRLSVDEARVLLAGAARRSEEIGVPMCTAVVDESGNLIAFERLDCAKVTSISIAIDKAFTGGGARNSTRFYAEHTVPGGPTWGIHLTNSGRFCIVGGGFPVTDEDGTVVGGIGVSGGSAEQDEDVAQAALATLAAEGR